MTYWRWWCRPRRLFPTSTRPSQPWRRTSPTSRATSVSCAKASWAWLPRCRRKKSLKFTRSSGTSTASLRRVSSRTWKQQANCSRPSTSNMFSPRKAWRSTSTRPSPVWKPSRPRQKKRSPASSVKFESSQTRLRNWLTNLKLETWTKSTSWARPSTKSSTSPSRSFLRWPKRSLTLNILWAKISTKSLNSTKPSRKSSRRSRTSLETHLRRSRMKSTRLKRPWRTRNSLQSWRSNRFTKK